VDRNNVVTSDKRSKGNSKKIIFVFVALVAVLIFTIAFQTDRANRLAAQRSEEVSVRRAGDGQLESLLASLHREAMRPVERPELYIPTQEIEVVTTPVPEVNIFAAPASAPAPRGNVITARVHRRPPRREVFYSNPANAQLAQIRREMSVSAIISPARVDVDLAAFGIEQRQAPQQAAQQQQGFDLGTELANFVGGMAGMRPADGGPIMAPPDIGGVAQKQAFGGFGTVGTGLTAHGYSPHMPVPQQFRWELKAGTIIPAVLMQGIDSSVPGIARAQVSQNVWDAHGTHVLIPRGTVILGVYNTDIRFGDRRLQVAWNRLIFPNGTTLDISGAQGADQAGIAGISGRVNNHWDQMFLAVLMSTAFVVGAETLYPTDHSRYREARTPREVAAEQLATEVMRVGTRLVDRAMSIPPRIRIRSGRRITVFVHQDIIFPQPFPVNYSISR